MFGFNAAAQIMHEVGDIIYLIPRHPILDGGLRNETSSEEHCFMQGNIQTHVCKLA